MSVWSFYRLEDGTFTGRTFSGPAGSLAANTPEGYGAAPGEQDHITRRVVGTTTDEFGDLHVVVEDVMPPPPQDDAQRVWAWDSAAKRYVARPTLRAVVEAAAAAVDAEAGAARLRYITDVPGQQGVYLRKLEQAKAFVHAAGVGVVPPYVAAEARAMAVDPLVAAEHVLSIAAQWDEVLSPAIEEVRIRAKRAMAAEGIASADQVHAIRDAAIEKLRSI